MLDELAQRFEVLHRVAAEDDRGVVLGVVQAVSVQVRLHPRHQVGDLRAFVLRLGEQEPEIPFPNELLHRPVVGGDPLGPALDLGEGGATDARAGRRPQADGGERTRLQPEALVVLPVRLGQPRVRLVEPHEVLALDVEHDGLGVRPRPAEHGGVEQGEQEEQRVRGLRRHPRDAADVEVGAPRSVEEVQVHEHRLSVPGQPRREPSLHLVEVQRLVPVLAPSAVRGQARQGRDEQLRLEARGHHLGRHGRVHRQDTPVDQKDVGVEAGPLVAGPGLLDDPGDPDR